MPSCMGSKTSFLLETNELAFAQHCRTCLLPLRSMVQFLPPLISPALMTLDKMNAQIHQHHHLLLRPTDGITENNPSTSVWNAQTKPMTTLIVKSRSRCISSRPYMCTTTRQHHPGIHHTTWVKITLLMSIRHSPHWEWSTVVTPYGQ